MRLKIGPFLFLVRHRVILSKMVGSDRPSVTIAVAELERDGVIERGRASISIKNRRKLEKQSCRCYSVFKMFNAELGLRS